MSIGKSITASAELPRGAEGRLVTYLIGPGFGESQVVLFPDGRCMVVDTCTAGDVNLPAVLLRRLGVKAIDLFVLSHADLDHVRGLPALFEEFSPRHVWRYPFSSDLRTLAARWLRQDAADRRLLDFSEALDVIDRWESDERLEEVSSNFLRWPMENERAAYEVRSLAPTQHDQRSVREKLEGLFERAGTRYEIAGWLRKYFEGSGPLRDRPNRLSLALSITWQGQRVLLGGDVEAGDASPHSGWKGVLSKLERRGRSDLLDDLDLIKVAHHGSFHSFSEEAWQRHAGPSTVAVLTPFDRGRYPLPDRKVLRRLLDRTRLLGVTCNARGAVPLAIGAGWAPTAAHPLPGLGPVLAVVLNADGSSKLHAGTEAAFFSPGSGFAS